MAKTSRKRDCVGEYFKSKIKVMNKEKLEILIKLPKQQFDAIIKLINPKVTDEDLRPMFPEHYYKNANWPEFKYDYDSFRKTQIQIDEWNEKMANWNL